MASPQLEKGYLRLANELAEQFYRHEFTARDQAVLRYLERHTYGYGRKECGYSTRAIADMTGLCQENVRRTITRLKAARVITVVDGLIAIQKDYALWDHEMVPLRGKLAQVRDPGRGDTDPCQFGTGQDGTKPGQVDTGRFDTLGQVGPETQANLTRLRDAGSASGADVRMPKDKRHGEEDHDLPPSPPVEGPDFSAEDLAVLKDAASGLLLGPRELPAQIAIHLRDKVRSGDLPEPVLQAYNAMPPAKLALWIRVAMNEARERARQRTALVRYAAIVISSALLNGGDLLNPDGPPSAANNVVNLPAAAAGPAGPYADQPWGWLWASNLRGTTCDREYVERMAQRALDKGDRTCSPVQALALLKTGGVFAAMDYIWAHYPRNKARNHEVV